MYGCVVCVFVQQRTKAKPGQSGQRRRIKYREQKKNPRGGMDVCCECCQVEVSATGRSLLQRSPIDGGVSLFVIKKHRAWGGPGPCWAVTPET
jgi:hypothetical protein